MKQANGFTLIELLVAMTAGAMLLGLLSWSVSRLAHELSRRPDGEAAHALIVAGGRIRTMVEGLRVPPDGSFDGTRAGFEGIVDSPQAAGPVGPLHLDLRTQRGASGVSLTATLTPLDSAVHWPAPVKQQILASSYRSIDFDYEARTGEGAERLPPKLITIIFTPMHGQITRLAMAPQIDQSRICHFDPISQECRK